MKRAYLAGVLLVSWMGLTAGLRAVEPEQWAPFGGGKSQSAYSWGPYTTEGTVLSDRVMERYGWPVGPFFLQPYASFMAIYDDNVFLTSREEDSEAYMTFQPGVMLLYGSPRHNHFYFDYSGDFTTLTVDDSDAAAGQSVTVGWRQEGAKSQFNLAHQFEDVRDVDIEVGTRLRRKSNTTTASFEERVSSKTSLGVLGRHLLNEFDDDVYADYRDYKGGARASWQMRPKTALYGQYDHGWVDVDESRDAYGSAQYDEASVGISGRVRPRLGANGRVGVQHRYFENEELDDITSEVGSLGISGEPLEMFQAWLNLSMGLRPAINARGYTVVDSRISPGISRRLFTDRLVGALSAVWGQAEYMGRDETPGTEPEDPRVYDGRIDRYWGFNANLDWWVGRYWSIGAGYSYINNDSDADGRMVDGRATDNASYDAGRWMIRASFNR